jgi:hypothetical protein
MNYVKMGWDKVKSNIESINEVYSVDEVRALLTNEYDYKKYFGRANNRKLMKENPKLYKSIYHHTDILETTLRENGRYKGWYNFSYRLRFIVENGCNIDTLKCKCGITYTWNTYCRRCPEYHYTWSGRVHTDATKKKQRLSTLKYLEKTKGQVSPRYNIHSIPIIEKYGKDNGYNFIHAENGGEHFISSLGYYLDGYDVNKNVVIEIDEPHHYNTDGTLRERDVVREREIKEFIGCEFIRIRYDR